MSSVKIDEFFSATGPLSEVISGYAPREGQVTLAKNIDRVLREKGVLLAEAPTGVGKSVGALVPLLLRGKQEKPSVIATSTIALQEQYVRRDIPRIEKLFGRAINYCILKGRSHYLCKLKLKLAVQKSLPHAYAVERWSETTPTGDRSELQLDLTDSSWNDYSSSASDCRRPKCPYVEDCWGTRARVRAACSELTISNYHALLVRGLEGQRYMLDSFGDVICDEAHELPKVARDVLGSSITRKAMKRIAQDVDEYNFSITGGEIEKAADAMFARLLSRCEDRGDTTVRLTKPGDLQAEDLVSCLDAAADAAKLLLKEQGEYMAPVEKMSVGKLMDEAERLVTTLDRADSIADPQYWTYWVENKTIRNGQASFISLESRPFVVAGILGRILFSPENHPSVTLMSATLRSSNGFNFIRASVGAPMDAEEITVPSPFLPAKQAAMVIPSFVRYPPKFGSGEEEETAFMDECTAAAVQLAVTMGGRTLCLFTSWKALDYAFERMSRAPKMRKFKILKQGDAPTQALIKEFTTDETSVLLGVASLWQGVDVPGDALKGLFIHKIPFPSPKEPITAAMSEYLDETYGKGASFALWSMPIATTALQQGMGRLIRSTSDTGVIVIADQRIMRTSYGRKIESALPRFSRFGSIEDARRVLPHVFGIEKVSDSPRRSE